VSGVKHDGGKPEIDLISKVFVDELARVLSFGAVKYGRYNWKKGFESHRLISAVQRHVQAFNHGIDLDDESGLSHLAHAAANLMFLIDLKHHNRLIDTRYIEDASKNQKTKRVRRSPKVRSSRRQRS
jgi:hypothetical protein